MNFDELCDRDKIVVLQAKLKLSNRSYDKLRTENERLREAIQILLKPLQSVVSANKMQSNKGFTVTYSVVQYEKAQALQPKLEKEELYPCAKCGKQRTKAGGGTTFTICDECWEIEHTAKNKEE